MILVKKKLKIQWYLKEYLKLIFNQSILMDWNKDLGKKNMSSAQHACLVHKEEGLAHALSLFVFLMLKCGWHAIHSYLKKYI